MSGRNIRGENMIWVKLLLAVLLSVFIIQCSYLPAAVGGKSASEPAAPAARESTGQHAGSQSAVRHKKQIRPALKKRRSAKTLPGVVDLAKGKVVFFRSSFVASAVAATVYDVTAGSPRFVAEVKNNTQVHYRLDAGNYTFMLTSDSSVDYLNVHVAPNLSYYAIVKPSMGAWKPSFSFTPIKARDSKRAEVSQDLAFFDDESVLAMFAVMTELVDVKERRKPNRGLYGSELMAKHLEHWGRWKGESPEMHALKTLNSLDGI